MPDHPLFSAGFPAESPTPQELDSVPSRVAQAQGVADNAAHRLGAAATVITEKAGAVADESMGRMMGPVEDIIQTATTAAGQAGTRLQEHAINALQSPLKLGIAYGYVPQGTPVYGLAKPRKRQSRKKTAVPADVGKGIYSGPGVPSGPSGVVPTPPPGPPGPLFPPGFPPAGLPPPPAGGAPCSTIGAWTGPVGAGDAQTIFGPSQLWNVSPPGHPNTLGTAWPVGTPAPAGVVYSPLPSGWPALANVTVAQIVASPFYGTTNTDFIWCTQSPPSSSPPSSSPPPSAPPPSPGGQTCVSICNWPPGLGSSPAPAAPPPPPPPECIPQCPPPPAESVSCTIPWLALNYSDFVLAERAAAKTDWDILVDAYKLGLCTLPEDAKMPACSMPMLEREFPAFVQAGQAQGLTDDQILRSAIDIGLCSKPEAGVLLGEQYVTEIAPESAQQLEAEYDPPTPVSGIPQAPEPIKFNADSTDYCPAIPTLPFVSDITDFLNSIQHSNCLVGTDRAILGVIESIISIIKNGCNCEDDSWIGKLGLEANKIWNQNTWWSKIVYYFLQALIYYLRYTSCTAVQLANLIDAGTGCGGGAQGLSLAVAVVIGVYERWIGRVPAQLMESLDRAVRMQCPTGFPTAVEANSLYATNFIPKETWQCLTAANGMQERYQEQTVKAIRRRPSDDELLLLQRKAAYVLSKSADDLGPNAAALKDEAAKQLTELGKLYEHNGWTNTKWWEQWQAAQQWIPSPQDAINWMLKDTEDVQILDLFKLDAEFAQKYRGHVEEVFAWNGITKKDADYLWRAHWRNMAPHTLYELHKRLRPGWTELMSDEEVLELVAAICPAPGPNVTPDVRAARPVSNGFPIPTYCDELLVPEIRRQWLESLATDGYQVSEALGQDDFAPFWRQRLLAVSYNVVTRVDARRAYETDQIDLPRLTAILQDRGYSPGDAARMAKFYRKATIQLHSRRPVCGQWVKVGYDPKLLKESLIAQGMRQDMWDDVYAILKSRRAIVIQTECVLSAQHNFKIGLVSEQDTRLVLVDLALDNKRIDELIAEWKCLRKARHKLESASEICLLFKTGLIQAKQAKDLLRDLGYRSQQAVRILALCFVKPLPRGYKKVGDLDQQEQQELLAALNS